MTAHLSAADTARIQRAGIRPLSSEQGLALLDAALLRPEATLAPVALDLDRLREQLGAAPSDPQGWPGHGHSLLRALIRPSLRRVEAGTSGVPALRAQLAAVPESERLPVVVGVVQDVAAAVLGLAGRSAVAASAPLKDLGLDSLMAVEVRNQLSQRVERKLPATLVFDYPTPGDMAQLILEALDIKSDATWSEAAVRAKLSTLSIATLRKLGVLEAIMAQPEPFEGAQRPHGLQPITEPDAVEVGEVGEVGVEAIFGARDEALFEMADRILMEEG
jgi:acyl carrier protein